MGLPVAPPKREDGLDVYRSETGYRVVIEVGALRVTIEGCDEADEAAEVVTAALERLAKRRGKLPAKIADRTAQGLRAALGR